MLTIRCLVVALSAAAILCNPAVARAQLHGTVRPDRIELKGGEFVPRFATYLPESLIVPAKGVVTLPADSTWNAIEVAGVLRVSPDHDTIVRFTHLMVLPGGRLEIMAPCGRRVEFVIRDVPIDTARDPFLWGNGLLNFGHQTRVGCPLEETWTILNGDVLAGATTLSLNVPAGWRMGDELVLPDTRQMQRHVVERHNSAGRERPLSIAAITGNSITLSKPVDFAHMSILDPDGAVVLRPRVANLTRNLVIRSENPRGVPGHTANVGHEATWDIQYNQLVGVGRTRNETLDNTKLDRSNVGTNPAGRYADHAHHAQGLRSQSIGNAYIGHPAGKWGVVLHGTSDALVERNVGVDLPGGCFITEDGNEVRNVFRRNFCAYSDGTGDFDPGAPLHNPGRNCPGCEGAGFWFRGLQQTIEGNESWNSRFGIVFLNQPIAHMSPGKPGGSMDARISVDVVPLSMRDNVTASNLTSGLDYWMMKPFPVDGLISAHNWGAQVSGGAFPKAGNGIWLRNATLVGEEALTACIISPKPYTGHLLVEDSRLVGCTWGVTHGGGSQSVVLRRVLLQNAINLDFGSGSVPDGKLVIEDVVYRPFRNHPPQFLLYGGPEVTVTGLSAEVQEAIRRREHVIINWQGTGQNFRLFERFQVRSSTSQGGALSEDEAVHLEGLLNGVARPEGVTPSEPTRGSGQGSQRR